MGKPHILIAEDEENIRDMIRCVLEARGFRVTATDNGLSALEFLRADPPDVLVTDILMPGITGLELCERVRSDEALKNLPVVVITSITRDSELADGFWRIGANSDLFITKPFDPFYLADRVERLLNGDKKADGNAGS